MIPFLRGHINNTIELIDIQTDSQLTPEGKNGNLYMY